MDKPEITELLKKIKRRYATFRLPDDLHESRAMINEWHENLQNVPFDVAAENLRSHAAAEDWPPSIAQLSRPLQTDTDLYHDHMRSAAQTYIAEKDSWVSVEPNPIQRERMRRLAGRH